MVKPHTLVSCAVAAAIAAAASRTHATDITTYQANQNAGRNVNVFISGATTIDNTINLLLTTATWNICQGGTVNEYQTLINVQGPNGVIGGGATETLWYCQAGLASGVSTTMYLAVFKESTAGSINGVQSLIAVAKGGHSGVTFLDPTGPDVQSGRCAGPNLMGACTASDFLQNVTPTGGVSDVEANLLRGIPGGGTLSASDISTYLASGAASLDIVWGLPVTKNLYYALQSAEGLSSKCPGGSLDSPACAPSLSKEQVASLFDRDITSWTSLGLSNPSGDSTVYICREGVGSGTEAAFEAYFLGARCGTSTEEMAAQDGRTVIESASSNGVFLCLQDFDLSGFELVPYNGDYNTTFKPFTPAGNQWAIGISSTEITPGQLQQVSHNTLRMVAIDGVLPTLENVVNGYDPFWSTDFWYYIAPGFPGYSPFSSQPFTVFFSIEKDIGAPVPTAGIDGSYINGWGNGGELAPASLFATRTTYASYPVTAHEVETSPVNLWTKARTGSVNNCDTPVLWRGAGLLVSPAESTLLGGGNINQGP